MGFTRATQKLRKKKKSSTLSGREGGHQGRGTPENEGTREGGHQKRGAPGKGMPGKEGTREVGLQR